MTAREWNDAVDYLMNAEEGAFVEFSVRKVVVENMCGGRYLMLEYGEVFGLTDKLEEAMTFLSGGRVFA